jgi:hypothetical protein
MPYINMNTTKSFDAIFDKYDDEHVWALTYDETERFLQDKAIMFTEIEKKKILGSFKHKGQYGTISRKEMKDYVNDKANFNYESVFNKYDEELIDNLTKDETERFLNDNAVRFSKEEQDIILSSFDQKAEYGTISKKELKDHLNSSDFTILLNDIDKSRQLTMDKYQIKKTHKDV